MLGFVSSGRGRANGVLLGALFKSVRGGEWQRADLDGAAWYSARIVREKEHVDQWRTLGDSFCYRDPGELNHISLMFAVDPLVAEDELWTSAGIAAHGRFFQLVNARPCTRVCGCSLDMTDGAVGDLVEDVVFASLESQSLRPEQIFVPALVTIAREFLAQHLHSPQVREWLRNFERRLWKDRLRRWRAAAPQPEPTPATGTAVWYELVLTRGLADSVQGMVQSLRSLSQDRAMTVMHRLLTLTKDEITTDPMRTVNVPLAHYEELADALDELSRARDCIHKHQHQLLDELYVGEDTARQRLILQRQALIETVEAANQRALRAIRNQPPAPLFRVRQIEQIDPRHNLVIPSPDDSMPARRQSI
ncbi:hypothetical protein GNI_152730 [Gregarina niphandrodes]|uniref:Uncharacterized protein n=1 Tax=Gregarina niphandrodes TaxID=110365 RepID=A0A023B0C0_GRENI|nr:hypothetical protein GNI_152730 [Gregarina niphandrodes]EZG44076.1 hypothetical protein GNI_152730 [Gregarina niphandrodes]|eukprot:XP_011132819.1 hypothetical protein GNI_152730 [Gregarina niphandrodes]